MSTDTLSNGTLSNGSLAKTNLLGLEPKELAEFFTQQGQLRFRANQLSQWVYQRGVIDFNQMTDMSRSLRAWLQTNATIELPSVQLDRCSKDGSRKWLLKLSDGNIIESVFIPETDRGTLCISSQAGCVLDCPFCATARQGFSRNLTAAEIIAQVWLANQLLGGNQKKRIISNIVMMGMGEPLYNYRHVVTALKLLKNDCAYGLSSRRITLSTAGVAPHIDKLAKECDVSLAISLHAPDNRLRDQLVPLNRRFPIPVLLDACRHYSTSKRYVTMEYIMLKDVNDRLEQALQLSRLLQTVPCKVNLIPFNSFRGASYRCSDSQTIRRFADVLRQSGLVVTTRKNRGRDIGAACGQLVGKIADRTQRLSQQALKPDCVI